MHLELKFEIFFSGPRQQLNGQTSFLDLSVVYGPNIKETAKLRLFKDGIDTLLFGRVINTNPFRTSFVGGEQTWKAYTSVQ